MERYLKRKRYQQKQNTILGNSSTNFNLKLRHLSGNLKRSYIDYTDKFCLYYLMKYIYIYIYIYIYCHPHADCFVVSQVFSVAKHARFPKLGSNPGCLKRQSKILPRGNQRKQMKFKRLCITFVLFTYISLTAIESSIQLKSLALR